MSHYPIYNGRVNISLGAMQREYVRELMQGVNDPDVVRGVLMTPPVTIEEEYAWFDGLAARKRAGTDVVFAILLHVFEGSKLVGYRYIGHTGLHKIRQPESTATSGTLIWDKDCFGKGYGKEAKLLLLHVAFHELCLYKVNSSIKAFNERSHGHLIACGYRYVGRRRGQELDSGKRVDEILFDVFPGDFEPIWNCYLETGKLPKLTKQQLARLKKESK